VASEEERQHGLAEGPLRRLRLCRLRVQITCFGDIQKVAVRSEVVETTFSDKWNLWRLGVLIGSFQLSQGRHTDERQAAERR